MTVATSKRSRGTRTRATSHAPIENSAINVDATTAGVGDIITRIAEEASALGAVIDTHLMVAEHNGHVTLGSATGTEGEPFIRLPFESLIPVDGLVWDGANGLTVLEGRENLTTAQQSLLDLHIQLWNATGKFDEYQVRHPRAVAARDGALAEQIRRLRPTFTPEDSPAGMVRTRTFNLRSDAAGERRSVIMPILELADHHPQGAPYRTGDGVLESTYRFVDETRVAYVRYGPWRDAMDLACLYGFSTEEPLFFVSAPLTLDLGIAGSLTVVRQGNRQAEPRWQVDEQGLTVDYLPFHVSSGMFESFIRPVRAYLEHSGMDRGASMRTVMDVAESLLDENQRIVTNILEAAQESSESGAAVVAEAAEHQLLVIAAIREGA